MYICIYIYIYIHSIYTCVCVIRNTFESGDDLISDYSVKKDIVCPCETSIIFCQTARSHDADVQNTNAELSLWLRC